MKTAGEWADELWDRIKAGGPRSWHGITMELIRDVREEIQEECVKEADQTASVVERITSGRLDGACCVQNLKNLAKKIRFIEIK